MHGCNELRIGSSGHYKGLQRQLGYDYPGVLAERALYPSERSELDPVPSAVFHVPPTFHGTDSILANRRVCVVSGVFGRRGRASGKRSVVRSNQQLFSGYNDRWQDSLPSTCNYYHWESGRVVPAERTSTVLLRHSAMRAVR